jgi:hypothetical protein
MKKRIVSCALLLMVFVGGVVMAGGSSSPSPSNTPPPQPQAEPANSFHYDLTESGIRITKYIGTNPRLVIPGTIEGYKVSIIGDGFITNSGSMIAPQDFLVSVVIPEGVTVINENAFRNQRNLTSVTFPSTLQIIGWRAFQQSGLRTIRLPDSLRIIYHYAFSNNRNLTTINIPASIEYIADWAFENCTTLSNVTIPSSISSSDIFRDRNDPSSTSYAFIRCGAIPIAVRQRLRELGYTGGYN